MPRITGPDVQYYAHNRNRRKPIAGSTTATEWFLVVVHEDYPEYTISQLRKVLTDKRKYIYNPEAVAVLDAYIKIGEGDIVPNFGL